MNEIRLLDKETIDKIAAGEVVERPASVIKELIENSIDAKAQVISAEIKNGGLDLIRVTDNGAGIAKDQLRTALLRHSTSKIQNADDLSCIRTLGFRGEALSSISAVSRLEILTKTRDEITGSILKTEGAAEVSFEDAGLPDGTTVIVRNLFYNVPARLKFLKSAKTEAGHILDIIEKLALSHPEISFKYTANGQLRLITAGNGRLGDVIYSVFGREISSNVLEIEGADDLIRLEGYIGKPEISRASRSLEYFFINGRSVKDKIIAKAVEDAYRGYQMKGSFPFCCINIITEPGLTDVNVHPSKLEVKFFDAERVYNSIYSIVSSVIAKRENISSFSVRTKESEKPRDEKKSGESAAARKDLQADKEGGNPDLIRTYSGENTESGEKEISADSNGKKIRRQNFPEPFEEKRITSSSVFSDLETTYNALKAKEYVQAELSEARFFSSEAKPKIKIVGQIFKTYWICELEDKMYIIDQHAAHEKVLYEKFMDQIRQGQLLSQLISPPVILTLSPLEELTFKRYAEYFEKTGFRAEHFGGSEYALTEAPATLYSSIDDKTLFLDTLNELTQAGGSNAPEVLLDRVATAACRAAVKGNNVLSFKEAEELISAMMDLENPYNCPHGRPTMIAMSKYELEKKFKRVI